VEASWRLQRWDALEGLLTRLDITSDIKSSSILAPSPGAGVDVQSASSCWNPDESFQISIGKLLNAIHKKDSERFSWSLKTARQQVRNLCFRLSFIPIIHTFFALVLDYISCVSLYLILHFIFSKLLFRHNLFIFVMLYYRLYKVMGTLSAASMESYGRAYPQLTRLHILRELETAHQYLIDRAAGSELQPPQSSSSSTPHGDQLEHSLPNSVPSDWHWNSRLSLMSPSFNHRLQVQEVRRVVMTEFGWYSLAASSWLSQSVALRKSGKFAQSLVALRNAEKFGLERNTAIIKVRLLISNLFAIRNYAIVFPFCHALFMCVTLMRVL